MAASYQAQSPVTEQALRDSPPWGTYSPKGYRRFLCGLVKLGLARGAAKGWFQNQWSASGAREPADLAYQGLKFRLHPWDNTIESKMLFGSKVRDWQEIQMLASRVSSGGVFLDIGANIGYYALMAALRGASQVLAFEPMPTAYQRLAFNIHANGLTDRVVPLQAALGGETKKVTLSVFEEDLGGSSIVKHGIPGSSVEVPMMRLQDVLTERAIHRIDAVKIDVEGMEDSVLCPFFAEAPRTLWPRFVIMEHVHRADWKEDVLSFMLDSGFRLVARNRSNVFLTLD